MFESLTSKATSFLGLNVSSWNMTPWWHPESSAARYSLLRILALAHREKLDLAPIVSRLSEEHRGAAKRKLRRFEKFLESGTPVVDALEQTPDLLRDEDVLALRFGSQAGVLSDVYEHLVESAIHSRQESSLRIRQSAVYAVCLSVILTVVLSFMMLFIAPTFQEMFDEFGLRLPHLLVALIETYRAIVGVLPILIFAVVCAGIATILFKPQRWFRRSVSSNLIRPIAQLRSAQLQRLLGISIKRGRPLAGSLSTLARFHFDRVARLKLLEARNNVEQGTEAWQSLADVDLLTQGEATALADSDSAEFRGWLLHRLALWREQRVSQRTAFYSMLLNPAVVLFFGVLVLWITTSFLSVLIAMASSLA